MRLIDADALIEDIKHGLWDWETVNGYVFSDSLSIEARTVLKQTIRDIQNMPTEVVTCKECKHRHTQWCGFYYKYEGKDGMEDYEWTYDDGYCSFGEWKIPEEIDEVVEK